MALLKFNITYKDGATQTVTAAGSRPEGNWLVFVDGTGEVLRVPAADVQSVARDDVDDRKRPEVKVPGV
jgi:hypothetical protein